MLSAVFDPQHAAPFRRAEERADDVFPSQALAAEDGDGAVDAHVAGDVAKAERHAVFERIVNGQIAAPVRAVRSGKAAGGGKDNARALADGAQLFERRDADAT